jgi:hypothetical protein
MNTPERHALIIRTPIDVPGQPSIGQPSFKTFDSATAFVGSWDECQRRWLIAANRLRAFNRQAHPQSEHHAEVRSMSDPTAIREVRWNGHVKGLGIIRSAVHPLIDGKAARWAVVPGDGVTVHIYGHDYRAFIEHVSRTGWSVEASFAGITFPRRTRHFTLMPKHRLDRGVTTVQHQLVSTTEKESI